MYCFRENKDISIIVSGNPEDHPFPGKEQWWHSSPWYETEALLIAKQGLRPACNSCGKMFSTNYSNKSILLSRNLCFKCNHWSDLALIRMDKSRQCIVIIEGHAYCYDPREPIVKESAHFLGFGGRYFTICFFNGKEVLTNNLWSIGEVPPQFTKNFPNEAKFITPPQIPSSTPSVGGNPTPAVSGPTQRLNTTTDAAEPTQPQKPLQSPAATITTPRDCAVASVRVWS